MAERASDPEHFGAVQFHPVIQSTDPYAHPEFTGGCLSSREPWLAEAALAVRDETIRRGFPTPKLIPSPCMVDMDDAFVVNHDGSLFKCVAMIGHPEYAVGDVFAGWGTWRLYRRDHWRENEECGECAYLPLCFGGCRYMELQRSGTMERVDCRREFYDRILAGTVQQDARVQAAEAEKPSP